MIRTGLTLTVIMFAISCALAWYGWTNTPPGVEVPVHFGIDGTPDRYGPKWQAFLIVPPIILGLGLLMAVLPSIDPRGKNLKRSSTPYMIGWIGGLAVATIAQGMIAWTIVHCADADSVALIGRGIAGSVGVLFLLLGNALPKARPNFFLGIRTPWTLTSDHAWEKTHRLGGRLFVLVGILNIASAFLAPVAVTYIVIVGGSLGAVLISLVYSYLVWRTAPDKHTGPQPE